jgi:hypothetical protein
MLKRICLSFFFIFSCKTYYQVLFWATRDRSHDFTKYLCIELYMCVWVCVQCIIIKNKRKEKGKKHTYYIMRKKKKLIIKLEFKDVWINPLVTVLTWRKGRQLNFKHFPNQLKVKNIFILSDKISSEEQNLFPILGHKGFRQFVHAPPHECL